VAHAGLGEAKVRESDDDLSYGSGGPVSDPSSHLGQDPFVVPRDERSPARRFRGRLVAPVTIWTATGSGGSGVGLTVSSVVVVEGDPPLLLGLLDPLADLVQAIETTGRFVVGILTGDSWRLAEEFAGHYPSYNLFAEHDVADSPSGPVLTETKDRAYCALRSTREVGWSLLVEAEVERFELASSYVPLVHHRGHYTAPSPR